MNGQQGASFPPQYPGNNQQGSTQIPLNPQGQPVFPQQPQQQQQQIPQGYPQNYGFQPQQPQQQGLAQKLALGGDEILDGAGVPPELRGRKVSDVMRIYSALADDFITRKRSQGQQPQNQNQQQQQNQPQSQGQPQNQQQPPAQRQSFWQNPDESLQNVVRQVVQEAVQPFHQQTLAQSAQNARKQAEQMIPDFRDLEPEIMEAVKGSTPEALANPEYWQHAADLARGRKMRAQQGQPQPQPTNPVAGFPSSSPYGPTAVPANQPFQQPMMPQQNQNPIGAPMMPQRPQTHQFFTEAPTAPSVYQHTHGASLSPQQAEVARLSGIDPATYQAWLQAQQPIGGGIR